MPARLNLLACGPSDDDLSFLQLSICRLRSPAVPMASRQLSALLLVLALSAHVATANFIGYMAPCDGVNSIKCTGTDKTLDLNGIKSCSQVKVGCYNNAFICGSFTLDNYSCPKCTVTATGITLECKSGSSCNNPSEPKLFLREPALLSSPLCLYI